MVCVELFIYLLYGVLSVLSYILVKHIIMAVCENR